MTKFTGWPARITVYVVTEILQSLTQFIRQSFLSKYPVSSIVANLYRTLFYGVWEIILQVANLIHENGYRQTVLCYHVPLCTCQQDFVAKNNKTALW